MSASNQCTFMGHVVREPELKTSQSGNSYTQNALGVNTGWGDNRSTYFANFSIFGKRAESFCQYAQKGDRILITCEATENEYKNKDGYTVKNTSFIVRDWEFAQSKGERNESQSGNDAPSTQAAPQSAPQSAPPTDNGFLNVPDGIDEEYLPFK